MQTYIKKPDSDYRSFKTNLLLEPTVFLGERVGLGLPLVDLPLHAVHDLGVLTHVEVDRDDVLPQPHLDPLGPVGVLERVVRVVERQRRRRDVRDHHRAAVAPDGVLQRQLGSFGYLQ